MNNRSTKPSSFDEKASQECRVNSTAQSLAHSKFNLNREYFSKVLIYGGLVILILGLLSIFNTEYHFSSVGASAFGFLLFAIGLILFCTSPEGSLNADERELRKQDNFNV